MLLKISLLLSILATLSCGKEKAAPPPPPPEKPPLAGAGTEASPYVLDCQTMGKEVLGSAGQTVVLSCPAGCNTSGWIFGTDTYTRDSRPCTAAIHAGVLTAAGGPVKMKIIPGLQAHEGSEKNGIKSSAWGSYETSYILEAPAAAKVEEAPEPATVTARQRPGDGLRGKKGKKGRR